MSPLRSRPCLRCCSQQKNRSSGHSFGEDLTVPGSSPPQKIHTSAVTSHPVPQLMLSGSSRGSQGFLKSPFCLVAPPNPHICFLFFLTFFCSLRVKLPADSKCRVGEAPSSFLHQIMLSCSPTPHIFFSTSLPFAAVTLEIKAGERMC